MTGMIKRWWLVSALLPLAVVLGLLVLWNLPLSAGDRIVTIKPGASLTAIARQLQREGIVTERYSFRLLAQLAGASRKVRSGEYQYHEGMSQRDLLNAMVSGKQVQYALLLVEGWNFYELMKAINNAPKLEHTLKDLTPVQVMERLSYGPPHPEGRFFPDTYHYTAGTPDIDLLRQAYDRMQQELDRAWQGRAEGLPYKNPEEALIMASIVEKETGQKKDRDRIAAVFVNRLKRGMRLQTDPTVIYGIGTGFDGNLRKRDLLRDTPYNTYTRRGLPPTPISMPGRESLEAALHPAPTDDLYFVSRGDGSSHFSRTLTEHNKAVRRYQLGGK